MVARSQKGKKKKKTTKSTTPRTTAPQVRRARGKARKTGARSSKSAREKKGQVRGRGKSRSPQKKAPKVSRVDSGKRGKRKTGKSQTPSKPVRGPGTPSRVVAGRKPKPVVRAKSRKRAETIGASKASKAPRKKRKRYTKTQEAILREARDAYTTALHGVRNIILDKEGRLRGRLPNGDFVQGYVVTSKHTGRSTLFWTDRGGAERVVHAMTHGERGDPIGAGAPVPVEGEYEDEDAQAFDWASDFDFEDFS